MSVTRACVSCLLVAAEASDVADPMVSVTLHDAISKYSDAGCRLYVWLGHWVLPAQWWI